MSKVNTDYTDKKNKPACRQTGITQINAKIISNKRIIPGYYKISIEVPKIAQTTEPGQFLNIRLNNSFQPLLRRPFSIHQVKGSSVEIFYAVVGKGTKILSQKIPGEYLEVIGPLGKGFEIRTTNDERRTTILVAGGMGVAPLIFLAEKLAEIKNQNAKCKILVLLGAKTKKEILCEKEFKQLGCEVKIATDDGSRGFKGKVTELLKDFLRRTTDDGRRTIYACGPKPMLREIALLSEKYKIPTQVSLEEHMACGIGACLGCVVKTKKGYKRVCKEGPVFETQEIIW